MKDNIDAITRNLSLIVETLQANKQSIASLTFAVQAILDTAPNKQEIAERYRALLQFHEAATGESVPRVLH